MVVAESGTLQGLPNGDQVLTLAESKRFEGTPQSADFRISHFENYSAYLGYQDVESDEKLVQRADFKKLMETKNAGSKSRASLAACFDFSCTVNGIISGANE
ncbi:Lipopolysaccharide export system permease protein lptF [Mannheimia haemolytica]|nr:Lipopolysaccharide export system permease protein lptF [Mannheimia haemolytica]